MHESISIGNADVLSTFQENIIGRVVQIGEIMTYENHFVEEFTNPETQYFILDSKGDNEHGDIDFVQYQWSRSRYNLVREGDLFIYRRPGKASSTHKFYFYGAGKIESMTGDDRVTGTISKAYPFISQLHQSEVDDMDWEWKERGKSWEHFFNQYGMNKIPKEDFIGLLDKVQRLHGDNFDSKTTIKIEAKKVRKISPALFINGIYESVLSEILDAQSNDGQEINFIQPYKGEHIVLLRENLPTPNNPTRLYISTTSNLSQICYTAEIVGWEDKQRLPDSRYNDIKNQLQEHQPGEVTLFEGEAGLEGKAINLVSIRSLRKLETLYSTSILKKVSDSLSLKKRTRSGGWSQVYDLGDLIDLQVETKEQFDSHQQVEISKANKLSDKKVNDILSKAPRMPEKVQVISVGYKRNPTVIVAVLRRADGVCEKCNKKAPFLRQSDGTPYLEVHHKKLLSEGGEDTVENAYALCPNCHRETHFGQ